MAPSRKTERELARLRDLAAHDWQDQREVLDRAAKILREASRQAGRDHEDLRTRVQPVLSATRHAAVSTREHLADDVLPALSSAFGSALAIIESAKDPKVRAALRRAGAVGGIASGAELVSERQSNGIGRYILIGVGLVAIAGVAYAAWQTLRADDDLWIDDEDFTEQSGDIQPS
jgi:ElaB/YqjD/DUF883 family membrane-anchored ribosome-binding protein